MKVETNSPTRESIQRTSRKMLSADDWAFQWNIDPNTARSMAYKGIPKVKNSESVNTTSSQCPLRTCIPPGKIEKKGVVMVAVPKKKKPRILMMQVTKAPIMDMAISPPIQINMNLKSPRNILPMLRQIELATPLFRETFSFSSSTALLILSTVGVSPRISSFERSCGLREYISKATDISIPMKPIRVTAIP